MLLTCLRQHINTTITSAVAFHSNYLPISTSTHKSAGVNCCFEIKSAWSLSVDICPIPRLKLLPVR